MSLKDKIRHYIWRFLGVDYRHILYVVDYVYFKEDKNCTKGHRSYDHNAKVFRWTDARVTIGRYSSLADNVRFIIDSGDHLTGRVSSYPFVGNRKYNPNLGQGIEIGNDVWIGQSAIILSGVKIGDGATVAAGSVVTRDVPPYTFAAGVPAKVIYEKCTQEEKAKMLELAWWNWDDEKVDGAKDDFALTIPEFLDKYYGKAL